MEDRSGDAQAAPRRLPGPGVVLAAAASLVALAGLGAAWWVHAESGRALGAISAEIAEIRASLDRLEGGADFAGLESRLLALEAGARNLFSTSEGQPGLLDPAPALARPATLPLVSAGTSAQQDDCMPAGTRFLVAAGDAYPVCGTPGVVSVVGVGEIDVTFADGTPILVGGSALLPGTACTVAVLGANPDGMTGYGELRVNC